MFKKSLLFLLFLSSLCFSQVDKILMLAADVSTSISDKERILQREGYIEAIESEKVLNAISSGYYGRIVVSYVEWSGGNVAYIADWTLIDMKNDPFSYKEFVKKIKNAHPKKVIPSSTSINDLITWATYEIRRSGYEARPFDYVLDISGDGPDTEVYLLQESRRVALQTGIVINGLAIDEEPEDEDIVEYYETCVIGGPGSFVVGVRERANLREAIIKKMTMEIASRAEEKRHALDQFFPESGAQFSKANLDIPANCYRELPPETQILMH